MQYKHIILKHNNKIVIWDYTRSSMQIALDYKADKVVTYNQYGCYIDKYTNRQKF